MSTTKKLSNITNKQISEKGIQALANRPNASAQYGVSGLSPTQLKLWFDKLATFLAEKINEIHNSLSSDEAAFYIRIILDEQGIDNIGDLVKSFSNGVFAEKILQVLPNVTSDERVSLQKYINDTAESFSRLQESIEKIALDKSNKLDKITIGDPNYVQLYAVDSQGNQIMKKASLAGSLGEGVVKLSAFNGQLNAPNQITYKPTDDQFVSKRWVENGYGDLPERVEALEDALIAFEQDDSTAHIKPVPLTSAHTAYINSIKGKTVGGVGKNKLDPMLFASFGYTVNADGTVTPNKTVTDQPDNNDRVAITLPAGTYSLEVTGNGNLVATGIWDFPNYWFHIGAITLTEPTTGYIVLEYGNGTHNSPLAIMLNEGSTALPFEPYQYAPTVVTEVKSYSANLIPFPYNEGGVGTIKRMNGITYTIGEDRSIHVKGMATGSAYFVVARNVNLGNFHMGGGAGQGGTNQKYAISSRIYYDGSGIVSLGISANDNVDDVVYPMANRGSQLLPYRPYFEPIIFKIPDGILALPDYGLSMPDGSFANTVDFDNKVYYHRCTKDNALVRVMESEEVIPISEYLKDSKYFRIEVQGGGEIEFINERGESVPSEVTFLLAP